MLAKHRRVEPAVDHGDGHAFPVAFVVHRAQRVVVWIEQPVLDVDAALNRLRLLDVGVGCPLFGWRSLVH